MSITTQPRIKYLTNKELLLALHKSKISFSSYSDKEYENYDYIINGLDDVEESDVSIITTEEEAKELDRLNLKHSLNKITPDIFDEVKYARSIRIAKLNHEQAQLSLGKRLSISQFETPIESINISDVIFRVCTYEHITIDLDRKRKRKTIADLHTRINFPAYQHWKFNENNELICVGKSHWTGDLDTGYMSTKHGKMTNDLALLLMKLADKYATKRNIRSYSYNDEMKNQMILQLIQVALQFNEAKSENPFSYLSSVCTNAIVTILNAEKTQQNIRDDILEMHGLDPSYTRSNSGSYNESGTTEFIGSTWVDYD